MSDRMEREVAQTERNLNDMRAAGDRAGQDPRTARFLELRRAGVSSEKALAQVDEEFGA